MNDHFAMPWLLPPPSDFKARAKALAVSSTPIDSEARRLSSFALGLTELSTLGKAARAQKNFLTARAGFTPFRLGIVSSHTMDYVAAALPATGLRHGLIIDVKVAAFGRLLRS